MTESTGNPGVAVVGSIGAVVVLVLGVVLYFSLVSGALERRDKAQDRLDRKTEQLEKIERNIKKANRATDELNEQLSRKKKDLKRERAKLQKSSTSISARREALKSLLPSAAGLASLSKAVSLDAQKAGVALTLFEPQPLVPRGPLIALPAKVRMSGTYHQVSQFLNDLTNTQRRIVTADDLLVVRGGAKQSPFASPSSELQRIIVQAQLTFYGRVKKPSGTPDVFDDRPVKNSRWKTIRGAFWEYSNNPTAEQRDPFVSHLSRYVSAAPVPAKAPPEVSPEPPATEDVVEKVTPEEVVPERKASALPVVEPGSAMPKTSGLSPLTRYPVQSYELLAVSLDAEPQFAVVLDPNKKGHRVTIHSPFGNAGGKVVQITSSSLVISEPKSSTLISLKLKN